MTMQKSPIQIYSLQFKHETRCVYSAFEGVFLKKEKYQRGVKRTGAPLAIGYIRLIKMDEASQNIRELTFLHIKMV